MQSFIYSYTDFIINKITPYQCEINTFNLYFEIYPKLHNQFTV